jgi:hypothetical protein
MALAALATVSACRQARTDENLAIDGNAATTDIEALPPDESASPPTDELVNGADNPDVGELNNSGNAD